jgi:hypothetical protein
MGSFIGKAPRINKNNFSILPAVFLVVAAGVCREELLKIVENPGRERQRENKAPIHKCGSALYASPLSGALCNRNRFYYARPLHLKKNLFL